MKHGWAPTQEKNNGFPFLDILGCLKNIHKNPKFGKVRQVPTREFPTKFPDWDFCGYSLNTLKYPKMGIRYFFLCYEHLWAMSALLLNLISCQSLRSFLRRRSLSLVESILGDSVGPGEKARRKFSSTGGTALPYMLEKTENFRRAFSPDWLPLRLRGCVESVRLSVCRLRVGTYC